MIKKICFIILNVILMSCAATGGTPFIKNMPPSGEGLIYLHQYCTPGGTIYFNGPKVYVNGEYVNDLIENTYLELSKPSGDYIVKVVWGGYNDSEIEIKVKPDSTTYLGYTYSQVSQSELANIVDVVKGTKRKADLELYSEKDALSYIHMCRKVK